MGFRPYFVNSSHNFLALIVLLGIWKEGVRSAQLPFIVTFLLFKVVFIFTGHFVHWPLLAGLLFSVAAWLVYGEGDYSKFRPSGKFRVGFRDFKSKELENDCSIFYPAAPDGSGDFLVPFLPYGYKHIEAFAQIVS